MTKEFINVLSDITNKLKKLRDSLPEIDEEEISQVNNSLAELDLSQTSQEETTALKEAFNLLAFEINETMERLDQHCEELKTHIEETQAHTEGLKAYTVAQNA